MKNSQFFALCALLLMIVCTQGMQLPVGSRQFLAVLIFTGWCAAFWSWIFDK